MLRFAVIALRNLARNRRRTLISVAIVAAGAIAILLTAGFIAFSFAGLEDAIIHGGLGHLELVTEEAAGEGRTTMDRSVAHGLEGWKELRTEVEAMTPVEAATATVHLMGMMSAGERSVSFVGVGVEPGKEREMGFEVKVRQGQDLPAEAPPPGEDVVLLALGLAESLEAGIGDVVTALVQTPGGMINAWDLEVVGLYTTGIQDLDTRFMKVHLATAQRLLETDLVSNLVVLLEETAEIEAASASIEERYPDLAVVDWKTRAPYYEQIRDLYMSIFVFLGSIVFVLVVLSASNTLMMTVMERFREIGTLRAIGTSRGQVAAIVLWEAFWLGIVGALVGDGIGLALMAGINSLEIEMPPPPGAVEGIDLQLAAVPEAFVGNVVLMVAVLLVAAIVPTAKAVRLEIVDALGHV